MRLEPVGLDRNYNRYWLLPAAAAATDPANPPPPEAPPLLVVERHSLDSLTQAGAAAAAAALGSATAGAGGDAAGGGAGWQVGAFSSILHLQQLAQWLNPKGSRERPLSEVVTRLLDQHQGWAMRHVQPRARMDEGAAEAQPGAASASALRALRSALLTFEEGNQVRLPREGVCWQTVTAGLSVCACFARHAGMVRAPPCSPPQTCGHPPPSRPGRTMTWQAASRVVKSGEPWCPRQARPR